MPARHAGADGLDHAGDFEAQRVGRAGRRRIEPGALHQVGPVNARRGDADQDFAAPGLRPRHYGQGERRVGAMNYLAQVPSSDVAAA